MCITRRQLPFLALLMMATACATTTRLPVTDVPAGNYVLVEPEAPTYVALSINEWAHTVREGTTISTGTHWVDGDGYLHVVDDEGPCAGLDSVWSYSYSGNRLTVDRVSDACTERSADMPGHQVFERR